MNNTMTYNSKGRYDLCDDTDTSDYRENIYLECNKCKHYFHAIRGQHCTVDNNFYCNSCMITNIQQIINKYENK